MGTEADASEVVIGDQRIELRRCGAASAAGPTIVLLHEGLGSAGLWRGFPERLAEETGRSVVAYSRAGYGASSPVALPRPLDYMDREGRERVGPLLDALGIGEAILYGHSDGGTIALVHAAVDGGARIRGLIVEAAHVFCEERSVTSVRLARDAFAAGELRARLERHHGANVDVAFRGWCDAWLDPGFRRWSVERFLPQVRCPTLIIQGEEDAYGTLAQVEAIAAGVAGAAETLVIPGCGHAPHRERPEIVLGRAGAFIRGILSG